MGDPWLRQHGVDDSPLREPLKPNCGSTELYERTAHLKDSSLRWVAARKLHAITQAQHDWTAYHER
jgi:hypothetical protein